MIFEGQLSMTPAYATTAENAIVNLISSTGVVILKFDDIPDHVSLTSSSYLYKKKLSETCMSSHFTLTSQLAIDDKFESNGTSKHHC